jgi:hypothetical protein
MLASCILWLEWLWKQSDKGSLNFPRASTKAAVKGSAPGDHVPNLHYPLVQLLHFVMHPLRQAAQHDLVHGYAGAILAVSNLQERGGLRSGRTWDRVGQGDCIPDLNGSASQHPCHHSQPTSDLGGRAPVNALQAGAAGAGLARSKGTFPPLPVELIRASKKAVLLTV